MLKLNEIVWAWLLRITSLRSEATARQADPRYASKDAAHGLEVLSLVWCV